MAQHLPCPGVIRDRGVSRRAGSLVRRQLGDDRECAAAVAGERREHRCPHVVAGGREIRRLVAEMDEPRRARRWIDPGHGPAEAVRHPDGAVGIRDSGGRTAELDRLHLAGPRIEARDCAAGVSDPDAAPADGQAVQALPDRDRLRRPVVSWIDSQQLTGLLAGNPDRTCADRDAGRRAVQRNGRTPRQWLRRSWTACRWSRWRPRQTRTRTRSRSGRSRP